MAKLTLSREQMTEVMIDSERVMLLLGVHNKRLTLQAANTFIKDWRERLVALNDENWTAVMKRFVEAAGQSFNDALQSVGG